MSKAISDRHPQLSQLEREGQKAGKTVDNKMSKELFEVALSGAVSNKDTSNLSSGNDQLVEIHKEQKTEIVRSGSALSAKYYKGLDHFFDASVLISDNGRSGEKVGHGTHFREALDVSVSRNLMSVQQLSELKNTSIQDQGLGSQNKNIANQESSFSSLSLLRIGAESITYGEVEKQSANESLSIPGDAILSQLVQSDSVKSDLNPLSEIKPVVRAEKLAELVSLISSKTINLPERKEVVLHVQSEGLKGVEVQLVKLGSELSVSLKGGSSEVINQLVNSKQDLQFSLENKLSNTLVRVNVNVGSDAGSDGRSRGEYVTVDDEEA